MPEAYQNVREHLGAFIGKTLIDITQHDEDEFREEGGYLMFMFEDASTIQIPLEAGFIFEEEGE